METYWVTTAEVQYSRHVSASWDIRGDVKLKLQIIFRAVLSTVIHALWQANRYLTTHFYHFPVMGRAFFLQSLPFVLTERFFFFFHLSLITGKRQLDRGLSAFSQKAIAHSILEPSRQNHTWPFLNIVKSSYSKPLRMNKKWQNTLRV